MSSYHFVVKALEGHSGLNQSKKLRVLQGQGVAVPITVQRGARCCKFRKSPIALGHCQSQGFLAKVEVPIGRWALYQTNGAVFNRY